MSLPTYEQLLERNKKLLEADKAKALEESDRLYDTQADDVTATYNQAIDKAKNDYTDDYEKNAVAKLINLKRIEEHNAGLGLTDSGLSATQRAAVELSAANQRGKIDLARRQAADNYAAKLAEAVSSIKINKASARANIENNFTTLAANNAQQEYKTNAEAAAKSAAASQSAKIAELQNQIKYRDAIDTIGKGVQPLNHLEQGKYRFTAMRNLYETADEAEQAINDYIDKMFGDDTQTKIKIFYDIGLLK